MSSLNFSGSIITNIKTFYVYDTKYTSNGSVSRISHVSMYVYCSLNKKIKNKFKKKLAHWDIINIGGVAEIVNKDYISVRPFTL